MLRVTEVATGRSLALKRLHEGARENLKVLFELEYQTLASLHHARTVEVFEYGRDGGSVYYTMELLAGEDLKDRAPVTFREAAGYLRDAALALSALHARKLVHRDVSPRNLWRTPDGRVKLIDFGALAPFGASMNVMGTPPCIAPEAVNGASLDGRVDLYSLGAVAYYLLTGTHAFPARSVRELYDLWAQAPRPPSAWVAELGRPELAPIPPELDGLVLALLRRDPLGRPGSAAEVIDRLDSLLGTDGRDTASDAASLALPSPAFVGRGRARRHFSRQLALAERGRGQSSLVEGELGAGRTRVLQELSLWARVAHATVLHVDAASTPGFFGVAGALSERLLGALPEEAREKAAPHAAILAHVSPGLALQLGASAAPMPEGFGELRVLLQAALVEWFLAVAADHTLVLLVDSLERCDEGSAAFLNGLARARKTARLLLVCAVPSARGRSLRPVERALSRISHCVRLAPLTPEETRALVTSLFGEAEHLARLVDRLQRTTGGNPGHILEICEQLVRRDVIGYASGSWVIPRELPEAPFSTSREAARAARLGSVSPKARELGQLLSVRTGLIPLELASALAASGSEGLLLHLGELVDEEILARSSDGLRFVHEQLRELLRAELDAGVRARAQRVVAHYLLSQPDVDVLERIEAGHLLLESGDASGAGIVAQASLRIALVENEKLGAALRGIERSFSLLEKEGRPPRELAALLAPLAMAGYYVDGRFAQRYGTRAIEAFRALVGLTLAVRLRPVLGRKLSLIVAVLTRALGSRLRAKNPCQPSFRESLLLLFSCVASLTASAATSLDPDSGARYTKVLEPFSAFGLDSIAGFMHAFCAAIVEGVRDKQAATVARMRMLLARLESEPAIRGMTPALIPRYLGGGLYTIGVLESQQDGDAATRVTERLDTVKGAHHRMTADQVRTLYYGHQGDVKRFDLYRERVEQHAIQQGASWQVETWMASACSAIHLRMHDAFAMKRTAEQVQRLSQTIPSLAIHARYFRGAYLVMRRRYAESLPWLEECLGLEPRSIIAWSVMHGVLARAYNALGDYARARTTCLRVLSFVDPADLLYTGFYWGVQNELLIAEVGLGHVDDAQRRLEGLIAQHAPCGGALTMGALHETGLQMALLAGDRERAERHLAEVARWYGPTGAGSLAQRVDELSTLVHPPEPGVPGAMMTHMRSVASSTHASQAGSATLTIDRMLAGGSMSLTERAHRGLQILAEHARCSEGFLFLLDESATPRLTAALKDERPSRAVERWVAARVREALTEEETQNVDDLEDLSDPVEHTSLSEADRQYRMVVLPAFGRHAHGLIGIAVLAARGDAPRACAAEVGAAVAYHLQRALAHEQTDQSASTF